MGKIEDKEIDELNNELHYSWKTAPDIRYMVNAKDQKGKREIPINTIQPKYFKKPESDQIKVLFIGLNPSFSKEGIKLASNADAKKGMVIKGDSEEKILKKDKKYTAYYNIEELSICDLDFLFKMDFLEAKRMNEIDSTIEEKHHYHTDLEELGNLIGIGSSFAQVDLFQLRVTDSKEVDEIYEKLDDLEFLNDQINRTLQYVKLLEPELVIVLNAKASKILKASAGGSFARFESIIQRSKSELPLYCFKSPELNSIPVILWSQLSSGTTGNEQKEHLIYSVRKTLKAIWNKKSQKACSKFNL